MQCDCLISSTVSLDIHIFDLRGGSVCRKALQRIPVSNCSHITDPDGFLILQFALPLLKHQSQCSKSYVTSLSSPHSKYLTFPEPPTKQTSHLDQDLHSYVQYKHISTQKDIHSKQEKQPLITVCQCTPHISFPTQSSASSRLHKVLWEPGGCGPGALHSDSSLRRQKIPTSICLRWWPCGFFNRYSVVHKDMRPGQVDSLPRLSSSLHNNNN